MPVVLIFIDPNGQEHRVEAAAEGSVMQAAKAAMVTGIEAVCGGNCLCGTCHCYVEDAARLSALRAPEALEASMPEGAPDPRPNSLLTCQIPVTESLDGMVLRVPASQH